MSGRTQSRDPEDFETFWRIYCVQNPERPVGFFLRERTRQTGRTESLSSQR
jgi:hypothetical protein